MCYVEVERISVGTVFKLLIVGFGVMHLVTALLFIVIMLLGVDEEKFADDGASIFSSVLWALGYLAAGVALVPIWASIGWVCIYPGIVLWSFCRPMKLGFIKTVPVSDTPNQPHKDEEAP